MKPPTATIRYPDFARTRHAFNMIEIIIALVVVLVGVIGIMALFPLGQKANQEAVGATSAADAGDQFLNYYTSKVKQHWALVNTIPLAKPGADEGAAVWQTADLNRIISEVHGVQIFYNDQDADGRYDYAIDTTNPTRDDSGLFQLVQRSGVNLDDFSSVIRVWKGPITYTSYDGATGSYGAHQAVSPDDGIRLFVEVSWPAELPYARRESKLFSSDVFRPKENDLETVQGAFRITQPGKLKVTYHGSDAGWSSALVMDEPVEQVLFTTNQRTDASTLVETEFTAGTTFNFHIETTGKCCNYGVYDHYAWAPEPPGCDCLARHLGGMANINPANNDDFEFTLLTPDGRTITRDNLHADTPHDTNGVFYRGPATYIRFKPKGNGNQNTFLVDGVVYLLKNAEIYTFQAPSMNVTLFNDKVKNGKCMGHWWIAPETDSGTVRENGDRHDALCPRHPDNRGNYAHADIPYYDNPPTSYHGAVDLNSGNPYCLVTEMTPGREWLLRFEDLPGARSDWDYNDVVISVELIVNDGVSTSLAQVPVDGTVTLNASDDWRVSIVRPDGTMITDATLGGGYNGPAAAIWFSPGGTGSQSLLVDGETLSFANRALVSVTGQDLQVNVYRSGTTWKADLSASAGTFTVMD